MTLEINVKSTVTIKFRHYNFCMSFFAHRYKQGRRTPYIDVCSRYKSASRQQDE